MVVLGRCVILLKKIISTVRSFGDAPRPTLHISTRGSIDRYVDISTDISVYRSIYRRMARYNDRYVDRYVDISIDMSIDTSTDLYVRRNP